jgi:hypothetical protein
MAWYLVKHRDRFNFYSSLKYFVCHIFEGLHNCIIILSCTLEKFWREESWVDKRGNRSIKKLIENVYM